MKRKNNIFFSAFVLIATFAFMLSPLGVIAATSGNFDQETTTAEACEAGGGVVKTNFYFLIDAEVMPADKTNTTVGFYQQFEGDTEVYPTGKTFNVGIGNFSNKIINDGKVTVTETSTGTDATSITEWSMETFYSKWKEAYTGTNFVKTEGNNSYAVSDKWYRASGDEIETNSRSLLPEDPAAAKRASLVNGVTSEILNHSSLKVNTTEIKIKRTYTKSALAAPDPCVETYAAGHSGNQDYGWIFQPVLYYVQYCDQKAETTPASDGFKVEYDANGGTSAPDKQDSPDGSPVNISDGKPNRNGYTFLGWSTDKNATEPDSRYAAGKSYAGPNDLYLYAVWSPKTGVSDYLMATAIVAGVAGLGLFISRRRRLFKQI